MSYINGYNADVWINQNHPEDGWFRVYWKDVIGHNSGGGTFDESEGEGLRWEWYYKNGKRDGISRSYWPDGILKQERTWKNGKQDGLYIEWRHTDGRKIREYTYRGGQRDGSQIEYWANGQKKIERTFKNGEEDGLRIEWYKNGQKKMIGFKGWTKYWISEHNWELTGESILFNFWDENGKIMVEEGNGKFNWTYKLRSGWDDAVGFVEGNYKNGKRDGKWIFYDQDKKSNSELIYKKGVPFNGIKTKWYENGQKKYERTYKDGKEYGLWTEWYYNGQKKYEETYKDGLKDGLVLGWHENGNKKYEQNYKKGKKEGLWIRWFINGVKKEEKIYKSGKPVGVWTFWYDNGQKWFEETYKDTKRINKQVYSERKNIKV
tara:strand:- start:11015 stop:12142 length:1128 start_codon:yes stop_codon:yes gene_type:complete